MGPRARARAAGAEGGAERQTNGVGGREPGSPEAPVPAADFWGGGAAALHDAIQPPDTPRAQPQPPGGSARTRGHRASRPHRAVRRAWGFAAAPVPSRAVRVPAWIDIRAAAVGAVIVCVLVVAGIGIAEGGRRAAPTGGRLEASRSTPVAASAQRGQLGALAGGLPRPSRTRGEPHRARAPRADPVRRTRTRRRLASRREARHRSAPGHARQVNRAAHHVTAHSPTVPVTTATAAGTTTAAPPAPSPLPTATTPVTSTTAPTTSSSGSGSSSPAPAPTHRSAFGQSGLLGAGHSSGDS
jgi:hypothetical protein